jgi:ectoine hydroxylase-related dioxygenase (phytanoyl-CoA dioxygenase family)
MVGDGDALFHMGWFGAADPGGAEVTQLRRQLAKHNGLQGIEAVSPGECMRATELFRRDGFVAVRDALSALQLERMRLATKRMADRIVALSGRDPEWICRSSFGRASHTDHLLHEAEWSELIDIPTITPILTEIFGSDQYAVTGGGGDVCFPGAQQQPLHQDGAGEGGDHTAWSPRVRDPSQPPPAALTSPLTIMDLPCPALAVNFLMTDFTPFNGPIRQIAGTQTSHAPLPALHDEPDWMRFSTLCPLPAGSAVIRDHRAWHGGTANVSRTVRAMPNIEFYAPWFRSQYTTKSMPHGRWLALSPHARQICSRVVAAEGQALQDRFGEAVPAELVGLLRGEEMHSPRL